MAKIRFKDNYSHRFPLELEGTSPSKWQNLSPGEIVEVSDKQANKLVDLFPDQFELEKEFKGSSNKKLKKTASFKSK